MDIKNRYYQDKSNNFKIYTNFHNTTKFFSETQNKLIKINTLALQTHKKVL